jgi:hypothetical protein
LVKKIKFLIGFAGKMFAFSSKALFIDSIKRERDGEEKFKKHRMRCGGFLEAYHENGFSPKHPVHLSE